MPTTLKKPLQNHISLVEMLFCARMILNSAQNAAKMRQDGPHERFCSFLSAKMEPQDAPKSMENPPQKESKNIL